MCAPEWWVETQLYPYNFSVFIEQIITLPATRQCLEKSLTPERRGQPID